MGNQYGERAGDLIRRVFDGYYEQMIASVKDNARLISDANSAPTYLN